MNRSIAVPLILALVFLGGGPPCRAQNPEVVTLRSAVAAALARSPGLAAAGASRDEGAAGARVARDAFRPAAAIVVTPGYESGLPVFVAGQVPSIGGIDVRQTLYDPAARAEAMSAEAAGLGRQGEFESARTETVRAVVALYARCRADRTSRDAEARRVSAAEELLRHAEARRKEGRETDLEVE